MDMSEYIAHAERMTRLQPEGMISSGGETLEDIFLRAYAGQVVSTEQDKKSVLEAFNRDENVTSPEMLFSLQNRTAEYNLNVQLYSALVRKAVNAVDTLVRA